MKRERFKIPLSVFVFLIRDNQVLVLRRATTGWMDNMWSVPAGAIDGNERLDVAACREVHEEVGVTIDPRDLRLVHVIHCFTEGDEWAGAFFATETWSDEPSVMEPHKHDAVQWSDLDKPPPEIIPYVKQAIESMLANVPYSEFTL